jgi:hypothetical protein
MSDLTGFGFWLGFWAFVAVTVVTVFRARMRKYQQRHEVILKLLETGQSVDPETLDKLLAMPGPAGPPAPQGPTDPRAGYRIGNSIVFMVGFATLFYAFTRDAGLSYPLIALGAFAIVLAFLGWRVGDKQFLDGTLPTLKYKRDPREAYLNGGLTCFWIGYATMFFGINREAGLSYPIIALGLLLVGMCFSIWRQGNKEYREGKLTGIPLEREEA